MTAYEDYGGESYQQAPADHQQQQTDSSQFGFVGGYQEGLADTQEKPPPQPSKWRRPTSIREAIDMVMNQRRELFISRVFYFFFFAAFGSLWPLLGVYFKQLGLSGSQSGLLVGFRPILEFIAVPFWGNVAERWKKSKQILILSLFCWILFTFIMPFIHPPAYGCIKSNITDLLLVEPWGDNLMDLPERNKRSIIPPHPPLPFAHDMHFVLNDLDFNSFNHDRSKRSSMLEEVADSYKSQAELLESKKAKQEMDPDADKPDESPTEDGSDDTGDTGDTGDTVGTDANEDAAGDDYIESDDTAAAEAENKGDSDEGDSEGATEGGGETETDVKPTIVESPKPENPVEEEEANSPAPTENGKAKPKPGHAKKDSPIAEKQNAPKKKINYEKKLPKPKIIDVGKSPLPVDWRHVANVNKKQSKGLVSPAWTSIVYDSSDIQSSFLLLLLLVIVGEFFSAPALAMADAATLGYLGDDPEEYGRVRMFGSLGWGISMFIVGIALDNSNIFHNHPCGDVMAGEKNYTVCFVFFCILMAIALIAATQFRLGPGFEGEIPVQLSDLKNKVMNKVNAAMGRPTMDEGLGGNKDIYTGDKTSGIPQGNEKGGVQITLQEDAGVAQQNPFGTDENMVFNPFVPRGRPNQPGNIPGWMTVLKEYGNVHYGSVLYMTWYMGFGVGLLFTFLFWHLQDVGGGPTLFGFISVINHVSEIIAYMFTSKLINRVGHINLLYVALVGNIFRFFIISYLKTAWVIFPFEILQGLTHAAVWAACCSYLTQAVSPHLRSSAQIILQGVFSCLGRGSGAIIGGILVSYYGTEYTFRGYAIACIVVLVLFFALNWYLKRQGNMPIMGMHKEPAQYLEESSHLAPCGVPMTMNRNLSASNLTEQGNDKDTSYGAVTNAQDSQAQQQGYGQQDYGQPNQGARPYNQDPYSQGQGQGGQGYGQGQGQGYYDQGQGQSYNQGVQQDYRQASDPYSAALNQSRERAQQRDPNQPRQPPGGNLGGFDVSKGFAQSGGGSSDYGY